MPVVLIEIDDLDLYKFITGGLHGMKAYTKGRLKIAGDLMLATQLEEVFVKTGGVEKTQQFLKKASKRLHASKLWMQQMMIWINNEHSDGSSIHLVAILFIHLVILLVP